MTDPLVNTTIEVAHQKFTITQYKGGPPWVQLRAGRSDQIVFSMEPHEFLLFADWIAAVAQHQIVSERQMLEGRR